MADDPWRDPPEPWTPRPIAWLMRQPMELRGAIVFAYWLLLAASAVLAGVGPGAALLLSLLAATLPIGALAGWLGCRRREWRDAGRAELWRVAGLACAGIAAVTGAASLVLPLVGLLAVLVWLFASLPLWLMRL